ncbi:MAG: hypothetical protein JWN62_1694 [Acidimicrobiales bacterium]|nr:hypothetical protein [Acidimicrobiales bacterium]
MVAGALDGVPAELEDFARARTASRAVKLELPLLTSRVDRRDGPGRIEAIQDLIRAAVVVSPDTALPRAAAEYFYPHDGRERTYAARRLEAAKVYGLETLSDWDRSTDGSPSRHQLFLIDVARLVDALSALRPNATVTDVGPEADASVVAQPARTRKVSGRVATAAVAAVALTGALVVAQPSPTAPSAAVWTTDPAVVVIDAPTDTTIKQASLAPLPAATPATTTTSASAATSSTAQTVPPPPVVNGPNGTSVALGDAAWHDLLALGLSATPTVLTSTAWATTIELSDGGALVGASAQGPFFWIPSTGNAYRTWLDTGGAEGSLGLPTSNPFVVGADHLEPWYQPGTYLEFRHGSLYAASTFADSDPEVVLVSNPLGPLDGIGDVHGHILRQVGGQAWMVDENDIAHFVPDAATFTCLNGTQTTVPDDIPGYTIAAFTRGDDATCVLVAD